MTDELLRNGSGYIDPTAYEALKNVRKGEMKMENYSNKLNPRRGEVYFLPKKEKETGEFEDFPVIVVSNDTYNDGSEFITVADLSAKADPDLMFNAPVMCRVPSVALCDRLRHVRKDWLECFIRSATEEEMKGVEDALAYVFGIERAADSADYKQMLQWKDYSKMLEIDLKSRDTQIAELKMIVENQAKEIKELNAMNNEMAGIAVELENSGQQHDFYRQFYNDLFHSGKQIEIKVG